MTFRFKARVIDVLNACTVNLMGNVIDFMFSRQCVFLLISVWTQTMLSVRQKLSF